jgi:hypothetical protein
MKMELVTVNSWNDSMRLKSIRFLSKEEMEQIKKLKREEEPKSNSQYDDDLPF